MNDPIGAILGTIITTIFLMLAVWFFATHPNALIIGSGIVLILSWIAVSALKSKEQSQWFD